MTNLIASLFLMAIGWVVFLVNLHFKKAAVYMASTLCFVLVAIFNFTAAVGGGGMIVWALAMFHLMMAAVSLFMIMQTRNLDTDKDAQSPNLADDSVEYRRRIRKERDYYRGRD